MPQFAWLPDVVSSVSSPSSHSSCSRTACPHTEVFLRFLGRCRTRYKVQANGFRQNQALIVGVCFHGGQKHSYPGGMNRRTSCAQASEQLGAGMDPISLLREIRGYPPADASLRRGYTKKSAQGKPSVLEKTPYWWGALRVRSLIGNPSADPDF